MRKRVKTGVKQEILNEGIPKRENFKLVHIYKIWEFVSGYF